MPGPTCPHLFQPVALAPHPPPPPPPFPFFLLSSPSLTHTRSQQTPHSLPQGITRQIRYPCLNLEAKPPVHLPSLSSPLTQ